MFAVLVRVAARMLIAMTVLIPYHTDHDRLVDKIYMMRLIIASHG